MLHHTQTGLAGAKSNLALWFLCSMAVIKRPKEVFYTDAQQTTHKKKKMTEQEVSKYYIKYILDCLLICEIKGLLLD